MTEVVGTIGAHLSWSAFEQLPALTANQFLAQIVPTSDGSGGAELILNAGFMAPPTITADSGAMQKLNESGEQPVVEVVIQPIARMSLTPVRVQELYNLLARILETQADLGIQP